jgi:4-hydroxy-tetrahydrodipicolinate synthase
MASAAAAHPIAKLKRLVAMRFSRSLTSRTRSVAVPDMRSARSITISVVSNVAPRLCVEMHDACRAADHHTARAIHYRLRPLIAALELESNPIPVKYALHLAFGLNADVRLPLTPVRPETASAIRKAMLALAEKDTNVFSPRRPVVNMGQWWG